MSTRTKKHFRELTDRQQVAQIAGLESGLERKRRVRKETKKQKEK
jgi:hypothetical protein